MTNNNRIQWKVGAFVAILIGLITLIATQAIIWTPTFIEIASVTWNDMPIL